MPTRTMMKTIYPISLSIVFVAFVATCCLVQMKIGNLEEKEEAKGEYNRFLY